MASCISLAGGGGRRTGLVCRVPVFRERDHSFATATCRAHAADWEGLVQASAKIRGRGTLGVYIRPVPVRWPDVEVTKVLLFNMLSDTNSIRDPPAVSANTPSKYTKRYK